jgi:hypothetical protein
MNTDIRKWWLRTRTESKTHNIGIRDVKIDSKGWSKFWTSKLFFFYLSERYLELVNNELFCPKIEKRYAFVASWSTWFRGCVAPFTCDFVKGLANFVWIYLFWSTQSIRHPQVCGKAYTPDNGSTYVKTGRALKLILDYWKHESLLSAGSLWRQLHFSSANKVTIWNVPESKKGNIGTCLLSKEVLSTVSNFLHTVEKKGSVKF